MGMFDWYIPVPDLNCPKCNSPLDGWQGKDAACGLFVWKQGCAYPIKQNADDSNLDEDQRKKFRLPEDFNIYNYCDNCENLCVEATCKTENEIWTEVIVVKSEK